MTFEAKYPGMCAYGDRIEPGDVCTYVDGEIAHTECDAGYDLRTPKVCPDCHLEHAGGCDW